MKNISIKMIVTFQECLQASINWGSETIVLFDIDNVLLHPVDILNFNQKDGLKQKKIISAYVGKNLDEKMWKKISISSWQKSEFKIIEEMSISFIKKLIAQKCNVFALTAIETGKYGVIDDMVLWRYKMLDKYGLSFSSHIPDIIFSHLPQSRNFYPCIYKGIICTNGVSKGKVLKEFLSYLPELPKQIVFFDDILKNLFSVARHISNMDIKTMLYHYHGASLSLSQNKTPEEASHFIKDLLRDKNLYNNSRY